MQNRDGLREQADSSGEGGSLGVGRVKQKGKRTHRHGQQSGDAAGMGV